jgi:hypothetical protein
MHYYVLYKVFILDFRVLAYIIFTVHQKLHFSAKSTKPVQNRQSS